MLAGTIGRSLPLCGSREKHDDLIVRSTSDASAVQLGRNGTVHAAWSFTPQPRQLPHPFKPALWFRGRVGAIFRTNNTGKSTENRYRCLEIVFEKCNKKTLIIAISSIDVAAHIITPYLPGGANVPPNPRPRATASLHSKRYLDRFIRLIRFHVRYERYDDTRC